MSLMLVCPIHPSTGCDCDQETREALWKTNRPGDDPEYVEEAFDASDPVATGKRSKAAKREANTYDSDLAWLMRQRQFRAFMAVLLDRAGLYRPSFVPGGDPLGTAFAEGMRNCALIYAAEMQTCDLLAYHLMISEQAIHVS
jgi:hypothetical protein